MKEIYVVTTGEYSDYGIDAVFSEESTAKEYASLLNSRDSYDHAEVETHPLDEPPGEWKLTVVRMNRRGEVIETYSALCGRDYRAGFQLWSVHGDLLWAVATEDVKRAIKVVNEKRTRFLADGTWGSKGARA